MERSCPIIILYVGIEVFVYVLQEVQRYDTISELGCDVQRNEAFGRSLTKISLKFKKENSQYFQVAEHASQMNSLNIRGGMLLGAY